MLRDKVFFFCWTSVLQVIVVVRGRKGAVKGQKQRAGRKTTDFLGRVPKSSDDSKISQLLFFSGCLVSEIWQVDLHVWGLGKWELISLKFFDL